MNCLTRNTTHNVYAEFKSHSVDFIGNGLEALAACTLCWGDPHDLGDGMAFAMAVFIPAFLGPLFVFLPVWLLHLILCVIEKRKEKKSY